MRFETTSWIVVLLGWVPAAIGGLVQDHHRLDPGSTATLEQPLGPNSLQLPTKHDNDENIQRPEAVSTPRAPAIAEDRSANRFDLSGTRIDAGVALLEAYAPRLDPSDSLPAPTASFSDTKVTHPAEAPVSVPLPPAFWPGVIALSLCVLFRRVVTSH
ncbi:MAG TPA: hypothetical protein VLI90_08590 [Tepidisphaeraceae bacterium]|nr:hypothetical protein [Tepidisphaeraceae bacterium]